MPIKESDAQPDQIPRNFKALQAAHYHTFASANTTNEIVSIAVVQHRIGGEFQNSTVYQA
jgi:hypothetical protein